MDKRDTKQRILDEALTLFSVYGYDGVSVKDIANAVGIKDSSLYKHFSSKRQIFHSLLDFMDKRYEETAALYNLPHGEMEKVAKQYSENDIEWLTTVMDSIFRYYTEDEYATKFMRLTMIEQYKSNEAARLFGEWFIDGALDFQTELFARMMEEGYFRKADPRAAAVQFYGPIFLLILMYDSKPEGMEEALELLHQHVRDFASNYHISRAGGLDTQHTDTGNRQNGGLDK